MKRLATTLLLTLGFVMTTNAQKEPFSIEQKTELALKKMTLRLDLTPNQVSKLRPLMVKQMEERLAKKNELKTLKESGKKPTKEQRFKRLNERLDKRIAFKNELKHILDEKQLEKFNKMNHHRGKKISKKLKHKKRKHKKH